MILGDDIILKKFLSLPIEKQDMIIDAALAAFGRNGYKKASVGDIAAAAGISKAMVFYYFGSKKALYFYLMEVCGETMLGEIEKTYDNTVSDFFDKIKMMTEIKMAAMKKHPAITSFIVSFYGETDPEVEAERKKIIAESAKIGSRLTLGGADTSKFKDDVDHELLLKFLIWAAEGFAQKLPEGGYAANFDPFTDEFYKCLDIMKMHFYKS